MNDVKYFQSPANGAVCSVTCFNGDATAPNKQYTEDVTDAIIGGDITTPVASVFYQVGDVRETVHLFRELHSMKADLYKQAEEVERLINGIHAGFHSKLSVVKKPIVVAIDHGLGDIVLIDKSDKHNGYHVEFKTVALI